MVETKRLIIRPLTADELISHLNSPNDLAKKLGLTPSQSLIDNETKEAIKNDLLPNIADPSKDPNFYTMWIIIEKSKMAIIGGVCFHGEPNEKGEVEIGYGTDLEFRNKGYMTETITGLVKWTQKNIKVRSIIAETEDTNVSSIRVLEKNGFILNKRNGKTIIYKLSTKNRFLPL